MASEEHVISGLALRYATAILELAQEGKSVEAVEKDFAELKKLVEESPDLYRLVKAPVFTRDQQKKGMDAILRRIEASPLTIRFVLTLAAKRRLFILVDIIRGFQMQLARLRGETGAQVTSAHPLSDAQIAELKRILKAKLAKDVHLDTKVDPSLLGGLIVKVGSRMIDSSLRTKLEGLRTAMRGH